MKAHTAHKKKYTVTLNESDMQRLSTYAKVNGIGRPAALLRLIKIGLRECASEIKEEIIPENQLCLFDSLQMDIFNNTTKTNNQR